MAASPSSSARNVGPKNSSVEFSRSVMARPPARGLQQLVRTVHGLVAHLARAADVVAEIEMRQRAPPALLEEPQDIEDAQRAALEIGVEVAVDGAHGLGLDVDDTHAD